MSNSARRASLLAIAVISATAVVTGGERQAMMTVEPRDWTGLATYPAAPPPVRIDSSLAAQPFWVVRHDGRDSILDGSLGDYILAWSVTNTGLGETINRDWFFHTSPPALNGLEIVFSPALFPGNPYYDAQVAGRAGDTVPRPYSRYCEKADMDRLRQETYWHEGAAANSTRKNHHAEYVAYFRSHDLGTVFERIVFPMPLDSLAPDDTLRGPQVFKSAYTAASDSAGFADARNTNNAVVHSLSNTAINFACRLRFP